MDSGGRIDNLNMQIPSRKLKNIKELFIQINLSVT